MYRLSFVSGRFRPLPVVRFRAAGFAAATVVLAAFPLASRAGSGLIADGAQAAATKPADDDARLLVSRANTQRLRAKMALLVLDPVLCKAAEAMARDRDADHPLNNPRAAARFPKPRQEAAAYYQNALGKGESTYESFGETVCHEPAGAAQNKTSARLDALGAWAKWQAEPWDGPVCCAPEWTAMGAAVYRSSRGSVCVVALYAGKSAPPVAASANPTKTTPTRRNGAKTNKP